MRLDPKFALAWALLSYIDARGYLTTNLQPTVALREEARQAAETALTLNPISATPYWPRAITTDPVVIDAVNEIESLTTNLSQKIWQKITIVDANLGRATSSASIAK